MFGLMSLKRDLYSAIIPPNALPLLSKEKKIIDNKGVSEKWLENFRIDMLITVRSLCPGRVPSIDIFNSQYRSL